MNEIDTILKDFDEEFPYVMLYTKTTNVDWATSCNEDIKLFISSHLTELLQGLILEIEGEKKDVILEYPHTEERHKAVGFNSALNLAQEKLRKLIK